MQVSRHLLRRSCALARPSPDRSRLKVIPLVQWSLRLCACLSVVPLRAVARLRVSMPARQPCLLLPLRDVCKITKHPPEAAGHIDEFEEGAVGFV